MVFDGTGTRDVLQRQLAEAIETDVGFEVTTFVRTLAEVRTALAKGVYRPGEGETYFVTFLHDKPTAAQARALAGLATSVDTLSVVGADVHWLMTGKSTDSRLVKRDWEKILGPNCSTSRNTTMLRRLVQRADG